jgi:hypothetical protein
MGKRQRPSWALGGAAALALLAGHVAWAAHPHLPLLFFIRRDVILAPGVTFARAADLDGDADQDFVGVDTEANDLIWWENTGAGDAFTRHTIVPAANGVTRVVPIDFDGDLDVDLATLSEGRNRLELWVNDAAGFTLVPGFSKVVLQITYIDAGDIDGDGLGDLLLLNADYSEIVWWQNEGGSPPSFQEHLVTRRADITGKVIAARLGDVDGDAKLDFATANLEASRISIWLQSDADLPTFERQGSAGLREDDVHDVAVGDIDRDGDADLFALRRMPYKVFAWHQGPPGEFVRQLDTLAEAPGTLMWPSLDAADVNGDGALDFLTTEVDGHLCWYRNPAAVPTGTPPTATSTGTSSVTPTGDASATPTGDATATPTGDATATPTGDATATPTPTAPTPTATTPVATTPATSTPTLSATPTASPLTATATPTATYGPSPTTAPCDCRLWLPYIGNSPGP